MSSTRSIQKSDNFYVDINEKQSGITGDIQTEETHPQMPCFGVSEYNQSLLKMNKMNSYRDFDYFSVC